MAEFAFPAPFKNTDGPDSWKYGGGASAWASIAAALAGIPDVSTQAGESYRKGVTIGVYESGAIVEYWWPNGTADVDLVLKGSSGSSDWAAITNKPTTVDGFGITDAVKSVNGELPDAQGNVVIGVEAGAVSWGTITEKPTEFNPTAHSHLWSEISDKPTEFTPSAHTHGWSMITGKPTINGQAPDGSGNYSIPLEGHAHEWPEITGTPTTLSGYGITDAASLNHHHNGVYEPAFTKNTAFNKNFGTTVGTVAPGNHTHDYSDLFAALSHAHTFASLLSKPTTLAGYGITDAAALNHTHDYSGQFAALGHSHTFASLTGKPTTLSGYGITDTLVKTVNGLQPDENGNILVTGGGGATNEHIVYVQQQSYTIPLAATHLIYNRAFLPATFTMPAAADHAGKRFRLTVGYQCNVTLNVSVRYHWNGAWRTETTFTNRTVDLISDGVNWIMAPIVPTLALVDSPAAPATGNLSLIEGFAAAPNGDYSMIIRKITAGAGIGVSTGSGTVDFKNTGVLTVNNQTPDISGNVTIEAGTGAVGGIDGGAPDSIYTQDQLLDAGEI